MHRVIEGSPNGVCACFELHPGLFRRGLDRLQLLLALQALHVESAKLFLIVLLGVLLGLGMVVAGLGLMATTSPDKLASAADTDAAQRSQYAENLQQP